MFGVWLESVWERLNSSFWIIPALLVLDGVVLFSVAQYLAQIMETNVASLPIVFSGGPTATHSVLSTIAGSLITVVATMFSLTVVALQLAFSYYYSPWALQPYEYPSQRAVNFGACLLETELGTEAADIQQLMSLSAHLRGGGRA